MPVVRAEFNAMHDGEPALVASPARAPPTWCDAVNFARDDGLIVAVRGGGHSIAGLSSIDGGMLIDLAPMRRRAASIRSRRLAHVQGGALLGRRRPRRPRRSGWPRPAAWCPTPAWPGLTLGGGYGWLRRKYGLSATTWCKPRS